MAVKNSGHKEMAREIFLALVDRWDVKDQASAENLARASWEIAEGYFMVEREKARPVVQKSLG